MVGVERAEHRQCDDLLARALISLLRFRLTPREQLVVRAILRAPTPPTAANVAKRTGLAYSHAKATVRNLVAWRFVSWSSQGLCFQPDASRWGPPMVPMPPNAVETDCPQKAACES